ncbi:MAG: 50S ribosomal protein L6 [bacterium]
MSRLGKLPIKLSEGVSARIENSFVIVKGPKGELRQEVPSLIKVVIVDNEIQVSLNSFTSKKERAFWGLFRSLIGNLVIGVTEGFEKKLEVSGIGYKAAISGKKLTLNIGYSHPIIFDLPEGINGAVEGNIITISGIDKQLVGEISAQIRKIKKSDPYKGKGIKYCGEIIRRKEGKRASKSE